MKKRKETGEPTTKFIKSDFLGEKTKETGEPTTEFLKSDFFGEKNKRNRQTYHRIF